MWFTYIFNNGNSYDSSFYKSCSTCGTYECWLESNAFTSMHLCQPTTCCIPKHLQCVWYPATIELFLGWLGIKFQEYIHQIGAKSHRKHRNRRKQTQNPIWKTTNLNWFVRNFCSKSPAINLLKDGRTYWILLLHLSNALDLCRFARFPQSIFTQMLGINFFSKPLFVCYLLPSTKQGVHPPKINSLDPKMMVWSRWFSEIPGVYCILRWTSR